MINPSINSSHENAVVVRITFDSTAWSRSAQWTLDTIAIGATSSDDSAADYDLTNVGTVLLFGDGGFAAWSGIGSRLMIFSADGKALRTIGRAGKGAGEFMAADIAVIKPELIVWSCVSRMQMV